MNLLNNKKIAIVYDRANKWGGAERVLLTLHEMFPNAPLYTSLYDPNKAYWAKVFPQIYTSFLQNIPFAKSNHELFGWLMPLAFEQFNFNSYDLVISVTSEAAKGIITGTNTLHICYCLTPTRYLWSGHDEYFKNRLLKTISKPVISYLRWWDRAVSNRPDKYIAISTEVKKRIKKFYNKESEVIFPPNNKFQVSITNKQTYINYYLYVGRLVKYKKVDLLIDIFNDLGLPLVIVGVGSQSNLLKHQAKNNIKFLGQISDSELGEIYSSAKAFMMPQEEDFGITTIESQSFGVPVIAYKKGGALDTVIDGVTGVFFERQTKDSLKQAIAKFDTISFNRRYLITNAKRFGKNRFKRQLQRSLIRTISSWRRRNQTLASI